MTLQNHVGNKEMVPTLGLENPEPRNRPRVWICEYQHSERLFPEAVSSWLCCHSLLATEITNSHH